MNYGKCKDYDICHHSIEISALKVTLPDMMCAGIGSCGKSHF